jgi:hypothetical protein
MAAQMLEARNVPAVSTTSDNATAHVTEATRQFTLWAMAALKLRVESTDSRIYTVHAPANRPEAFNGAQWVRFSFQSPARADGSGNGAVERVTPSSPLFKFVVAELRRMGKATHAAPARQPVSVHEITPGLFAAYSVAGGHVHLGGCHLEDRPVLRLTYRQRSADGNAAEELQHCFIHEDGQLLDNDALALLHIDELAPSTRRSRNLHDSEIQRWLETGQQLAAEHLSGKSAEFVAATIIWCKHAEGKLSFVIGEQSAGVAFAGWAHALADGQIKPPPFTCPWTGKQSYQLAATDDGRITVAEAIATCEASKTRVLEADLQTCEATSKRALSKYFAKCPVSEQQVLKSALAPCSMCRQKTSPTAIKSGRCDACRHLQPIRKDEPRLARVLHEYPKLDRWRSWKIAETTAVYVLTATALLRQLLVVVDKDTLELRHLATGARLFPGWTEVAERQRGEYMG